MTVAWYAWLRHRIGPIALVLGALLWPGLLGVASGLAAPGASFLFVLPTLGAAFGVLVTLAIPSSLRWWKIAALTVGAAVTVFLLPQLVWELLASSGGIASGAMVASLIALLAFPLLTLLELAFSARAAAPGASDGHRMRRLLTNMGTVLTAVLLLACGSLAGAGLVVDRFDAEHPRPAHLHYVLDADSRTASWVSRDHQPSAWTCGYVDCEEVESGHSALTEPFPWVDFGPVRTGSAAPASLGAPEATVIDDHAEGDSRVVKVRLRSAREAPVLSLYVDQPVTDATVADLELTDAAAPEEGPWAFGLEIQAPPPGGVVVTLHMVDSDTARMRVVDHSYGLDDVPGFTPRPAGIGVSMAPSDVVSVGHTITLRNSDNHR